MVIISRVEIAPIKRVLHINLHHSSERNLIDDNISAFVLRSLRQLHVFE